MESISANASTPSQDTINRAFSKQAVHYDEHDARNQILVDMRNQVYDHLHQFLKPKSKILELNAGTGIDAMHLANEGHTILATDWSDGMVNEIYKKIDHFSIRNLTVKKLSYTQLDQLKGQSFDYVFSNFGGLNCIDDLSLVARHLPQLLREGAFLTWVIMPPVCAWEIAGFAFGHGKKAFRRFSRKGSVAHLENELFTTYYHSCNAVRSSLGQQFRLVKSEGLCALSPPPHRLDFPDRHRNLYRFLRKADRWVRNSFPFNRWADHLVLTFRYEPSS